MTNYLKERLVMKRVTRLLCGLLALVLMAAIFTSCSKPGSNNSSATKEKVNITFWHNWSTGPAGDSIKKAVEEFNSSQNNIVVKPLYVATDGGDSITSKLLTAVAGGTPPEVMLASRYGIAEYMDALTPLNNLAKKDKIDGSLFYPWAWNEANYDGTLLGLPYDGTARLLFYNKDQFTEAGLDPNNPPKTIDELTNDALKLTKKDGTKITRFGFIPWYGEGYVYTWGWAFGGSFYDTQSGKVTANDPKIVDALTWMTNLGKQLGAKNVSSFVSSAGTNANDPFISGQLSMEITGNWTIQSINEYNPKLNYGIANIPSPDGTNNQTYVGGRALIIPKGIKGAQLDAAWTFVKWMCTSEAGQSIKKITGEFPAMPSVTNKIYASDPLEQKFVSVLPNGHNRPVILAGNMMWDDLVKAPDLVMNNQGTPKQVLDQITNQINTEVATKKAQAK
jgi:multiple sugar transport system substrate-binding protein